MKWAIANVRFGSAADVIESLSPPAHLIDGSAPSRRQHHSLGTHRASAISAPPRALNFLAFGPVTHPC